ncbi:hypothetical protein [Streptomyces sp. NBC_01012]|uniref:hypothetical protein n=1 Tax=Streptomyces sp. NBC_01012 TaxID=2903717 RepID=UPI00386BDF53|nr:hypothetical protein OG623_13105 [Streptomyces sp. NBC_01012]
MRDDATVMPSGSSKRKKIVFTALGILVVAGVGVALLLPDQKPTLSIPDTVCAEAVPSAHVKALLPEKGEAFEEERAINFMADAKGPGTCDLSGGGRILEIKYGTIQDPEYDREWVQRNASKPDNTPLSLGPAGGYLGSYGAEVFVDCPYAKGRKDLLRVSVGIGGVPKIKDDAMKADVSGLAADVARAVARDVVGCEGAADLPDSAPKIG